MKARKGIYEFSYMSGRVQTPASIVGALAVHRKGGNTAFGWTVSHIATEAHAEKAMPPRFFGKRGTVIAGHAALVAWAKAWQEAAPEFFAALEGPLVQDSVGVHHDASGTMALAADAVAKGRSL